MRWEIAFTPFYARGSMKVSLGHLEEGNPVLVDFGDG